MKIKHFLFLSIALGLSLSSFGQYSWNNVGTGTNSPVRALATDTTNHLLYAGGVFTQAGGIPAADIAKWNGVVWSPVGAGVLSGTGVSSLIMDTTNLIAGGSFTNIGGILAKNIAKWDGISWQPLGAGLDYTGAVNVNALAVYNNELYAGGVFDNSGGSPVSNIAKWNGTNWLPLTTGTNGPVYSLCVYGTDLYVGGTFTNAGGVIVNNIAKWNGLTWSDVGGGVFYTGATTVSTMKTFAGSLYVGGTFTTAGSTAVKNIAKWDGLTWGDVGGGAQGYTGATTVSTMKAFNSELVVGGTFDSLGLTPASYIGKWNGTTWTPLGTGTNNSVLALECLVDTLYAGGLFPMAGGIAAPFVAEWIPNITTEINNISNVSENFIVYPNPVEDKLHLHRKVEFTTGSETFSFILVDMLGRVVYQVNDLKNDLIIDRNNLHAGIYFYKIVNQKNALVQQGKLSLR